LLSILSGNSCTFFSLHSVKGDKVVFMEGGDTMNPKIVTMGAVILALLVGGAGGSMLNALQANAADTAITPTSNSQTQTSPTQQDQVDPTKGGHVGVSGVKEVLLTGDTEKKVKAAALGAVSGGTIERVETDAEGSLYEAHMTKADGTHVTVKVDSNFKVTSVETDVQGGSDGPAAH
jgi:hypothetical protein